ncbi:MAG TPA: efflux RND transporter periplasmic adaptor subunit [Terriglobia bacterium]|nr:efflux RND transporter periplasmic adaptor subunit [Terriglobia bacterium]
MNVTSLLKLKHVIWTVIGIVAAVLFIAVSRSGGRSQTKAPALPEVKVASVEQKDVPIYGEWIGTLAGQVNANVQAQVSGYLLKRDYQEGSFVRKGQLLFEIDPRPLQAVLDQAEAQLAQAKAQLANAQANQVRTQLDVDRYTPLAKAEAASQQDLDNAVQNNLAARANVETAKAQIQSALAAIETATINLNFARVTSPVDGIADVARAQVGDLVSSSSGTLTTVSTLDPIRDYFTVSEQGYLELQNQFSNPDRHHWKLQLVLSDGTVYPHEGSFFFAGRAVDQNTGAIQLAALFPNPGNVLRPGQFGKIRAVIQTERGALLVPQPAVTELQGSYQVDVVGEDDKIAIRPVKVGDRVGTAWIIQDGLKAGERVVAEGQQTLRPGMLVQPKPYVAE